MSAADVIPVETRTPEEMRAKIVALEAAILREPQGEYPTRHHHAPGIYMREVTIPRGHVVTGAIHKTAHLNILAAGEIAVWTEDGPKRLKAPAVIPSKPGIKRAGYAIEDAVWITVCHNPSNEQDEDKLFSLFTTNSFEEFERFMEEESKKLLTEGGQS